MSSYTVQAGDTLFAIAAAHSISLQALIDANPQLGGSTLLQIGQVLNLPAPTAGNYVVQPGDTLFLIAQAHGISLDALIAANPQLNGSTDLSIGQVLQVPGQSTTGGGGGGGGGNNGNNGSTGNADLDQALAIHNQARRESPGQSRPDLVWDQGLANDAQGWANHLAETGQFAHSGAPGEGENLFKGFPTASFAGAAQGWVDERAKYHGELIDQGDFQGYGHYTQVIWPSTTRVGLAAAQANGATVVVGRYSPSGNFKGQTPWS